MNKERELTHYLQDQRSCPKRITLDLIDKLRLDYYKLHLDYYKLHKVNIVLEPDAEGLNYGEFDTSELAKEEEDYLDDIMENLVKMAGYVI